MNNPLPYAEAVPTFPGMGRWVQVTPSVEVAIVSPSNKVAMNIPFPATTPPHGVATGRVRWVQVAPPSVEVTPMPPLAIVTNVPLA